MSKTEKKITDLVPDIYKLMEGEVTLSEENVKAFSERLHTLLVDRLVRSSYKPALRASNFGTPCDRKLWYTINTPEDAAPLPPRTRLKFLFGDILEEMLLFLAEEAGHKVEGTQEEMIINGVKGHRDAVIDGVVIDIKSANGRSFYGFTQGLDESNPFHAAYIKQLDFYVHAGQDDPIMTSKNYGGFLAFNKEKGDIHLGLQAKGSTDWKVDIDRKKAMLASPDVPPRGFTDVPDGKSGNMKLQTVCGYCNFKDKCWPHARTFLYSGYPRHLTKVVRTPDVPELRGRSN